MQNRVSAAWAAGAPNQQRYGNATIEAKSPGNVPGTIEAEYSATRKMTDTIR
jgi:hypothetical protein